MVYIARSLIKLLLIGEIASDIDPDFNLIVNSDC